MNPQRRNELAQKFVSQLHCDVKPISVGNKSDSKLVEDLKKRYGDNYNSKNDRYL